MSNIFIGIEYLYPGLLLYRQAVEFMDSLSRMRNCDWVIHKRLGEFKHAARGCGKSPFYYWPVDEDGDS